MNTLAKIAFVVTCSAMLAATAYYEVKIQKIRNKRHTSNKGNGDMKIVIVAPLPVVRVKSVRSIASFDKRIKNLAQ